MYEMEDRDITCLSSNLGTNAELSILNAKAVRLTQTKLKPGTTFHFLTIFPVDRGKSVLDDTKRKTGASAPAFPEIGVNSYCSNY